MQKQFKEYRATLKEWRSDVFQKWWGMVGSLATLAGLIAFAIWAREINPPLPLWNVALVVGGVLIFAVFSFQSLNRVRIERDEALNKLANSPEKPMSESEIKLREMRLKVRNTKVSEIPNMLIKLRKELESIAAQRKVSKSDPGIILSIYMKTLGINLDDPIFKIKLFDNKKMLKALQKRIGIKKYNPKKIQEYRLRFSDNIDSYKIGVENLLTGEFKIQKKTLDDIVTSDKLLNNAIDDYIQNIISFNNMKVFWDYIQNIDDSQVKNFFDTPDNKTLQRRLIDRIDKDIKESLADVLRLLEKYQTGEPLNEEAEGDL